MQSADRSDRTQRILICMFCLVAITALFLPKFASATEPIELSDHNLDAITAGTDAIAIADATAAGTDYAATATYTDATVDVATTDEATATADAFAIAEGDEALAVTYGEVETSAGDEENSISSDGVAYSGAATIDGTATSYTSIESKSKKNKQVLLGHVTSETYADGDEVFAYTEGDVTYSTSTESTGPGKGELVNLNKWGSTDDGSIKYNRLVIYRY